VSPDEPANAGCALLNFENGRLEFAEQKEAAGKSASLAPDGNFQPKRGDDPFIAAWKKHDQNKQLKQSKQ